MEIVCKALLDWVILVAYLCYNLKYNLVLILAGKVQTLIGRMQSLIQQLDTIYDAEGMNAALTKNYDKPSVGMDGWSK